MSEALRKPEVLRRDQHLALTGLPFLVEPLNGGLRPGGLYLLAGAPGANKSTLAVQLASECAIAGGRVLYLLTEQAPAELDGIVRRVKGDDANRLLANIEREPLDDVEQLPELLFRKRMREFSLIVIDSLQGTGLPGTALRTYGRLFEFMETAKRLGATTLAIAHITKNGKIAGPKALEHKVDVAVFLAKVGSLRQLFVTKNRFGPEVTEPLMLVSGPKGLAPAPHTRPESASALGYCGSGDMPLEVQVSISLPRSGERAELNAPFLPARRIRQIVHTVAAIPGIELRDVTYAINALVPDGQGYTNSLDLALAVGVMAAHLRRAVPAAYLFAGGLDLRRNVRPPSPHYLAALVGLLASPESIIDRVYVSSASAGLLSDLLTEDSALAPARPVEVIGVVSLDELVRLLWPDGFASVEGGGGQ